MHAFLVRLSLNDFVKARSLRVSLNKLVNVEIYAVPSATY